MSWEKTGYERQGHLGKLTVSCNLYSILDDLRKTIRRNHDLNGAQFVHKGERSRILGSSVDIIGIIPDQNGGSRPKSLMTGKAAAS